MSDPQTQCMWHASAVPSNAGCRGLTAYTAALLSRACNNCGAMRTLKEGAALALPMVTTNKHSTASPCCSMLSAPHSLQHRISCTPPIGWPKKHPMQLARRSITHCMTRANPRRLPRTNCSNAYCWYVKMQPTCRKHPIHATVHSGRLYRTVMLGLHQPAAPFVTDLSRSITQSATASTPNQLQALLLHCPAT